MGKCSVVPMAPDELQVAMWSYQGSGTSHGPANPHKFSFDFKPDFVAFNGGTTTLVRPTEYIKFSNGINSNVSWGDKDVSVWNKSDGSSPEYGLDNEYTTYHVFAIGRKHK